MKLKHVILGLPKEHRGGAANHSRELAKQMQKRGIIPEYYAQWWEGNITKVNLETKEENKASEDDLRKDGNVFHLQTHTWEHTGVLRKLNEFNSKILYTVHAVIPYFLLSTEEKKSFLKGEIPISRINEIMNTQMKERERAQIFAMKRANTLLTISKNHKKVIQMLGIDTPTYVFENPSDMEDVPFSVFEEAREEARSLREDLGAEKIFLYCGFLYEKKGAQSLFDSFREFRRNIPSKLILLGSGEDRKDLLFRNGMKKEDLEHLVFVPWIDTSNLQGKKELISHYFAADALIQPIITDELYSKTVIDAMHLGLPTITCKSPYTIGTSESAESIYNAMKQLEGNPKEVKRIVQAAQKKVERENTWDNYLFRLEKIVSE